MPIRAFALMLVAALFAGCDRTPTTQAPVTSQASPELVTSRTSLGTADASVVTEFRRRVDDYMALQNQLASTLKPVPDKATPQQFDAHQRALLSLVAKARPDAKPGNTFSPEMQAFVRGVLGRVLEGPDGKKLRASIMDENPTGTKIQVNGRYPDAVPLSTMPPDVLAALPTLPEDLEYRFVGNRLILFDTKAHLIIDYVEDAFPR